jgi:hypothetical protein
VSSYKTYIISILCILLFISCSINNDKIEKKQFKQPTHNEFNQESQYIIFALEYENFKDYNSSRFIYKNLFEKTNKYEYFVKYLSLSFFVKDFNSIKSSVEKYYLDDIKEEEQILKWHIYSLSALKDEKEIDKWGSILINKYNNASSYEILAKVYYDLKKYKMSYEKFKLSNELEESVFKISTLANINFKFLNKKNEAKEFLKQTIDEKEYDYTLSLQLLSYYGKDREFDKMTNLLQDMYLFYNKKSNKRLLKNTKKLFINYSFRLEDINKLIGFLEKFDHKDFTLLELYKKANRKNKAYEFLQRAYALEKKADYLGQLASLEFEMAVNKKVVLNSVIKKFEKVLETSSESKFQNYLAYLLIDYDLDINKGMFLVKQALEKEPENLAYLDTLAWGEYKLKNCKKAFDIMKDIVKQAGLLDEEIKLHWKKIKECHK